MVDETSFLLSAARYDTDSSTQPTSAVSSSEEDVESVPSYTFRRPRRPIHTLPYLASGGGGSSSNSSTTSNHSSSSSSAPPPWRLQSPRRSPTSSSAESLILSLHRFFIGGIVILGFTWMGSMVDRWRHFEAPAATEADGGTVPADATAAAAATPVAVTEGMAPGMKESPHARHHMLWGAGNEALLQEQRQEEEKHAQWESWKDDADATASSSSSGLDAAEALDSADGMPPNMTDHWAHLEQALKVLSWENFWESTQAEWSQHVKPALDHGVAAAWERMENVETAWQADAQQGLHRVSEILVATEESPAVQRAQEEWDRFLASAKNFTNSSIHNVENEEWFQEMSEWFQEAWINSADQAHELWQDFQQQRRRMLEKDGWWNQTVTKEREWYANLITNLHRLGGQLSEWLDNQEEVAQNYEEALHGNFARWWNETDTHRRIWWRHTRKAFWNFLDHAEHEETVWWNIARHAFDESYNSTLTQGQTIWEEATSRGRRWWNITREVVTRDAQLAWNESEAGSQFIWHLTKQWFRAQTTYTEELDLPIVYLNDTSAYARLMNGYGWFDYSADFFNLQQGWDAQINQAYCAVASVAAVLNSLRGTVDLPIDSLLSPYPYAIQTAILDSPCVNENVVHYTQDFDGIFHAPGGLNMAQAKALLECYLPAEFYKVEVIEVDPAVIDLDEVRREMLSALEEPHARVIVNYGRQELGQVGGGHFSPVGSYYRSEDRFLIMDVAKYKYPAAWVPAAQLYTSMTSIDRCGSWDFPNAQDMDAPSLLTSYDRETYMNELSRIGCQPTHRGFITIRPILVSAPDPDVAAGYL